MNSSVICTVSLHPSSLLPHMEADNTGNSVRMMRREGRRPVPGLQRLYFPPSFSRMPRLCATLAEGQSSLQQSLLSLSVLDQSVCWLQRPEQQVREVFCLFDQRRGPRPVPAALKIYCPCVLPTGQGWSACPCCGYPGISLTHKQRGELGIPQLWLQALPIAAHTFQDFQDLGLCPYKLRQFRCGCARRDPPHWGQPSEQGES